MNRSRLRRVPPGAARAELWEGYCVTMLWVACSSLPARPLVKEAGEKS